MTRAKEDACTMHLRYAVLFLETSKEYGLANEVQSVFDRWRAKRSCEEGVCIVCGYFECSCLGHDLYDLHE